MSDIQFKNRHTNRYDVSMEGLYSLDVPYGTWAEVNKKFAEWEVRRGFITKEEQEKSFRERLRGSSLRASIGRENREKALKANKIKVKTNKSIKNKARKKPVRKSKYS